MRFCINQPIEKYGAVISGAQVGPYYRYRDRPALLGLILLTTSVPYYWEAPYSVPIGDRPGAIAAHHEGLLADSLCHNMGGKLLAHWVDCLDPLQMSKFVDGFDLSDLPLCREFPAASVVHTIKARAAAWAIGMYGPARLPIEAVNEMVSLDKITREEVLRAQTKKQKFSVH